MPDGKYQISCLPVLEAPLDALFLHEAQGKRGPYGGKLVGFCSNHRNGSFLELILKVNIMLY